jgi:hypothetical protein
MLSAPAVMGHIPGECALPISTLSLLSQCHVHLVGCWSIISSSSWLCVSLSCVSLSLDVGYPVQKASPYVSSHITCSSIAWTVFFPCKAGRNVSYTAYIPGCYTRSAICCIEWSFPTGIEFYSIMTFQSTHHIMNSNSANVMMHGMLFMVKMVFPKLNPG